MKRTIVLATRNLHKVKEIIELLNGLSYEIKDLSQFPEVPDIEETGETFEENAILKARTVHEITGLTTLADDSGLMVDALDGEPGVFSARFAGKDVTYDDNNRKLLKLLEGISWEDRGATFISTVAFVDGGGRIEKFEGSCRGTILFEPKGAGGFGYDPLFFCPELGKSFAEMTDEEKNLLSHRAIAMKKVKEYLKSL